MTGSEERGFTLAAAGDSILTRSVLPEAGRRDGFEAVVETLRRADVTATNLETVLCDDTAYATPPRPVGDQFQYLGLGPGTTIRSAPSLVDELAAMGVDLFGAASNHSYDFGRAGVESTMRELRRRDLAFAGIGRSLSTARAPGYATTPAGRVGLVAATTSVAPGSEAGAASSLLPGRPGVSPLHVEWTYKATEDRVEQLRDVAEAVGIEDVKGTWTSREDAHATDRYEFMHMRFESVDDEADEGIELSLYEPDREAILAQVREANSAADWVVMSLHAHQGPGGTRNVPESPAFLVDFARDCVDAGADAFVGTGPHVLRGVEVYDGKPIFHSLGNFFCQFETLDRLPAQSFEYYGVEDDGRPSAVFDAMYYEDGEPTGNLAYPEYWRTVVPTCHFDEEGRVERIELLPCSLGRTRERSRRGTPLRADDETADRIFEQLAGLSEPFDTEIEREGGVGVIDPN